MRTRGSAGVVSIGILISVLLGLAQALNAEGNKSQAVPDKAPTVVKGKLTAAAKARANAAKLTMPLDLTFKLPPGKGLVYEGAFYQDGDGPVGKMRVKATVHLLPQPAQDWPVTLAGDFKATEAFVEVWSPEGKSMVKATDEDLGGVVEMPSMAMDKTGRVAASYNPGDGPLGFLSDLWSLPLKPLDVGDTFVEDVAAEGEDSMPFKGTRTIKLVGTRNVNGAPCAVYAIKSNLELRDSEEMGAKTVLKMLITSEVVFDTTSGWPLEAKQQVKISGKVDTGEDDMQPFNWKMSFAVKRVEARN